MKEAILINNATERIKIGNNLKRIFLLLNVIKRENNHLDEQAKTQFNEFYENLKEKLDNVLIAVSGYETVKLNMARIIKMRSFLDDNIKEHQEKITEIDQRRKISHDNLISYINELLRFINRYFKDNTLESIKKNVMFNKVILPKLNIFPDDMDIKDRKHIEKWADIIYEEIKNYAIKMLNSENPDEIGDEDIIDCATNLINEK